MEEKRDSESKKGREEKKKTEGKRNLESSLKSPYPPNFSELELTVGRHSHLNCFHTTCLHDEETYKTDEEYHRDRQSESEKSLDGQAHIYE